MQCSLISPADPLMKTPRFPEKVECLFRESVWTGGQRDMDPVDAAGGYCTNRAPKTNGRPEVFHEGFWNGPW